MSVQRQFNRNGITLQEAQANKRETGGVKRAKKNRHYNSYRSNALTVKERIERAVHLKGFFGINPDVKMSQANPRRKPSKYTPHVGGKGYKAPRAPQVRVGAQMTMTQIFQVLKDKFRSK